MWKEIDPRIAFLLQNSLQSYRHELLVNNFTGIPLLLQHGSADENVPTFHSRRMHQLISQSVDSAPFRYNEMDGIEHWFDGIMCTAPLRAFYADVLGDQTELALPLNFTIVVADPYGMGSRGGIHVDQLWDPIQLGKIEVRRNPSMSAWILRTSNIRRLHFTESKSVALPLELTIDSKSFTPENIQGILNTWFFQSRDRSWQVCMLCSRRVRTLLT